MSAALRIALFVEGSISPPRPRRPDPLQQIWNRLREALGLRAFDHFVPISKKHLVAMDPDNPPMSGAGEPLDALMARHLARQPFDVAVVAWDLIPAWNPSEEQAFCRWQETLRLYRFLAASEALSDLWKERARERLQDLQARSAPAARSAGPRLVPGMVLPMCMEPMFETLLVQDEAALRRALGIDGQRIEDWPRWHAGAVRKPDRELLGPAIRAVRAARPRLDIAKRIPGDMHTHKNDWGEYLISKLLADTAAKEKLVKQPVCARLAELLGE